LRHLYSFFLYCLLPFVLLRLFILGFRSRGYWSRWRERLGFVDSLADRRPVIWVHAVSVGEVEASKPLVQRLLKHKPQYRIVLTTVTPTGAETALNRFGKQVTHFYLPYDLPYSIKKFIYKVRPSLCLVMETELWPNMFFYCEQGDIPVILASARLSLRSLKGYMRFRELLCQTLDSTTRVLAQSKLDAERYLMLGCQPRKLSVIGNLKYDVEIPTGLIEKGESMRLNQFSNRSVWIAASTHSNEESLVLDAHRQVLEKIEDAILILAPRHPHRFEKVAKLCEKKTFELVRKSEDKAISAQTNVYLLDTLGDLQLFISCADVAFMGGSLVPSGGHNMLEPASLGVPVVSGTSIYNFQSICDSLIDVGALCLVNDSDELAEEIGTLLEDKNMSSLMGGHGRELVVQNQGCADKIISEIAGLLK
jgi:3-deoxy-D-manno-octulosonic-acid transferase